MIIHSLTLTTFHSDLVTLQHLSSHSLHLHPIFISPSFIPLFLRLLTLFKLHLSSLLPLFHLSHLFPASPLPRSSLLPPPILLHTHQFARVSLRFLSQQIIPPIFYLFLKNHFFELLTEFELLISEHASKYYLPFFTKIFLSFLGFPLFSSAFFRMKTLKLLKLLLLRLYYKIFDLLNF